MLIGYGRKLFQNNLVKFLQNLITNNTIHPSAPGLPCLTFSNNWIRRVHSSLPVPNTLIYFISRDSVSMGPNGEVLCVPPPPNLSKSMSELSNKYWVLHLRRKSSLGAFTMTMVSHIRNGPIEIVYKCIVVFRMKASFEVIQNLCSKLLLVSVNDWVFKSCSI